MNNFIYTFKTSSWNSLLIWSTNLFFWRNFTGTCLRRFLDFTIPCIDALAIGRPNFRPKILHIFFFLKRKVWISLMKTNNFIFLLEGEMLSNIWLCHDILPKKHPFYISKLKASWEKCLVPLRKFQTWIKERSNLLQITSAWNHEK